MDQVLLSFTTDTGFLRGKLHAEVKLYSDRIEIYRDTHWAVSKQTVLFFDNITSVSFRPSKYPISEQWIKFTVPGSDSGVTVAVPANSVVLEVQAPFTDENVIIFKKNDDQAEKYFQTIQKAYSQYRSAMRTQPAQATIAESPLDKLKKMKELLDLGVISQAEYEEKRIKLLQEI